MTITDINAIVKSKGLKSDATFFSFSLRKSYVSGGITYTQSNLNIHNLTVSNFGTNGDGSLLNIGYESMANSIEPTTS